MKLNHHEILQQAQEAAQQEDWTLLNQCLLRLLLSEEPHDRLDLATDLDTSTQLLSLALQALKWGDFQDRWEVAKVFPAFGQTAIAPLIDCLQNETLEVEAQWFAVRILGNFNHPDVAAALVRLLKTSQDEELNGMAVTALGNLGSAAIDILEELLQQETTRLRATQALAQIRRSATVPVLLKVAKDANPQIRATALESLSSFHTPEILTALMQATQDSVASVRQVAVTALGFCGAEAAELDLVAHLRPLLLDLNPEVCQQAAIALGRLGSASATEALFQSLRSRHTPEPLATNIVRALSWSSHPQALQFLQEALSELPLSEAVQQEILVVLGRVQPELKPQATQILLDVLTEESAVAQSTTAKRLIAVALGQLGDLNAIDPLIALLADSDASVRLHVVSALKSLAPDVAYQRLEQLSQSKPSDAELSQGVTIALKEWQF